MEIGKYYYTENKGDRPNKWWSIFKPIDSIRDDGDGQSRCNAKFITSGSKLLFSNGSLSFKGMNREFRGATDHEIRWLDECIKQGKYIDVKQDVYYLNN